MPTTAPYRTWASPIDAGHAVAGLVGFSEVTFDGENLYRIKLCPSEGCRRVSGRHDAAGVVTDMTGASAHPRTLVPECGGGSVSIGRDTVVFSEPADQRLHLLDGGDVTPIANALDDNGIPCAHITYEGEDHGFRKAENIVHSLESELSSHGRVFGFGPSGDIPSVPIVGNV